MLCLTRRVNESLQIGDATVTLLSIGANRVRLGIEAPESVAIRRTEFNGIPASNRDGVVRVRDIESAEHVARAAKRDEVDCD